MDISPALTYRDPRAAMDFLEDAFGFEPGMRVEDGDEIVLAELWSGDSCLMLGGERHEGLGQAPGSGWSYVVVQDAGAHYARGKRPAPRSSGS
jgi:uncharacterized glyoxalase superfamily protein PhnB